MTVRTSLALAALLTLNGFAKTHAHHSTSTYDVDQNVTIEGTVTRVQWVNPHVFIYIDQTTDAGATQSWAIEGVNPSGLRKVGWSRDTLKLGDTISVTGNPSKNMASPGLYPQLIFHDDRKLWDEEEFFVGAFAVEEASSGTSTLAGVWKNSLNPSVIIPREADVPFQPGIGLHGITERGLEALAEFDESTMNPALNCEEISAPLIMHFGDNKEILIEDDAVRIISEYDSGERIVHLGMESHDGAEYSNQGHSIGTLSGTTLKIDTTHFSENNFGNGFGLPSSRDKHLLESLVLSDDGRTISYSFTLTDPVYLAEPMTLETTWSYLPGAQVIVDECDLESARRFLEN